MAVLVPFLEEHSYNGRFVLCLKGRLAQAIQESIGDALFNSADGRVLSVECKADGTAYDRIFLETFSNKNLECPVSHAGRGSKAGWLFSQGADILLYHRLQFDELLAIPLFRLKQWAFGHEGAEPNIYRFQERKQRKFDQLNDTWGRCVDISIIEREVGLKRFSVQQLTLWSQGELA